MWFIRIIYVLYGLYVYCMCIIYVLYGLYMCIVWYNITARTWGLPGLATSARASQDDDDDADDDDGGDGDDDDDDFDIFLTFYKKP